MRRPVQVTNSRASVPPPLPRPSQRRWLRAVCMPTADRPRPMHGTVERRVPWGMDGSRRHAYRPTCHGAAACGHAHSLHVFHLCRCRPLSWLARLVRRACWRLLTADRRVAVGGDHMNILYAGALGGLCIAIYGRSYSCTRCGSLPVAVHVHTRNEKRNASFATRASRGPGTGWVPGPVPVPAPDRYRYR